VNRDKIIHTVDKLVTKGNLDKAAAQLKALVDSDPRDWNAINRLGDIYARLGSNQAANEMFGRIAEHFADNGFNLKAIAMYKKVLRLDASHLGAYQQLATLYQAQGLTNEARTNYQYLADYYFKEGNTQKARETYAKIAEMEPDNVKVRLKLAELLLKDGQAAEAVQEYQTIGAELMRQGMLEEAIQVFERALGLDAGSVDLMRSLAEAYSELDQHYKAIAFLKNLVQKNPDSVELQQVLGECYAKAGEIGEAEKIFEEVVAKDPMASGGLVNMSRLLLQRGDAEAAFDHFAPVVDELKEGGQIDQVEEFLTDLLKVRPDHIPSLEILAGLGTEGGADDKVLSNRMHRLAEAYVQENRWEAAAEILQRLTELDPENAQHQEKLAFVTSKMGAAQAPPPPATPEPAPPQLEVEPAPLEDLEAAESLSFDLGSEEPAPIEEPPPAAQEASAAAKETDFVHEHLAEAEVFVKYGLMDKAVEQLQAIVARFPANAEVHQKLKDLYMEEGLKDKAVDEMVTIAEIFRVQEDEDSAQDVLSEALIIDPNHAGLLGALEGSGMEIPAAPPPAAQAPAEPAAPQAEVAGGELPEDQLEEVDFYISQDFKEEALELLEELRETHGDHPEIVQRMQQLRGEDAAAASESDEEVFAEEKEFFDLASDLSEELGEDISIIDDNISQKSIDELVGDIKKRVGEQVEEEDWETHYNLGIAYKEMALIDEAIAEFQHAAKDASRFLECASLLGRCFIEKGMPQLAVQWYTRGLSAEGYGEEEMHNLSYELAILYEQLGNLEKAYEFYCELHEWNGSYRDVGEKVKTLGSQLGK